jgi:hypothetical protein
MTVSIICEVTFNSERAYFAKAIVANYPSLHYRLHSSKVGAEILDRHRMIIVILVLIDFGQDEKCAGPVTQLSGN